MAITGAWLLFFAATLALYWPFLNAPYFSDDFLFVFTAPPAHFYNFFFIPGPVGHAYRPVEAIILTWIQAHYGLNTIAIHLVSMAAHAALCCAIWVLAVRIGLSRIQTVLACCLMLVTQVGPGALLGNDSMSQAMSSALGDIGCVLLAIAYLDYAETPGRSLSWPCLTGAFAATFLSFFFKETALGLTVVAGLLTALIAARESGWQARIGFAVRRLVPYAVAVAIYFGLRIYAVPPLAEPGDHKVSLGMNAVKNLAEFGYAMATPISSVTTALTIRSGRLWEIALGGLPVLIVLVGVVAGLRAARRKWLVAILVCCVMASLFPALVLQHVSELYVYNAMPWVALLFGLGLGELWVRGPAARVAMAICTVTLFGGLLFADRQKSILMDANGRAAARLVSDIAHYVKQLPANGEIVLTEEAQARPKYSVYVLNGLDVLEFGDRKLGAICGRPDVKVTILPKAGLRESVHNPARLVLELKGHSLVPW